MKREVAAETGRFFRGVCPILNRAIYNETLNILWHRGCCVYSYAQKAFRTSRL